MHVVIYFKFDVWKTFRLMLRNIQFPMFHASIVITCQHRQATRRSVTTKNPSKGEYGARSFETGSFVHRDSIHVPSFARWSLHGPNTWQCLFRASASRKYYLCVLAPTALVNASAVFFKYWDNVKVNVSTKV